MPIHFNCSVCNQRLRVQNFAAGRITKCTGCGNAMRVPQPTAMLDQKEHEDAGGKSAESTGPPAEFSVEEVWYRSWERLSGSADWLAERPIRSVYAALIIVTGIVGISAAKWALNRPPEPILSVEPEDPEPWDGVGSADGNDTVRVTLQSAVQQQIMVVPQGRTGAVKTPAAYMRIELKIENLGATELKYSGWSLGNTIPEQQAARMSDDSGVSHKQVSWRAKIIGQTSPAVIPPSGSITDVLVFENTGGWARYLKLTLPAGAYGGTASAGTGNLRIKIPQKRSHE